MENRIHYGFGDDYLKNWGVQEALREIYQNFLDYGNYEETFLKDGSYVNVTLENDWNPESLDFLRIGNSKKNNPKAIGKHGEGVKMAFLILLRMGLACQITTKKYVVTPEYYTDAEIGNCFCFVYKEHNLEISKFSISFTCFEEDFLSFRNNIIREENIIFSDDYYGDVVNKENGNIYSGDRKSVV